jgi:hypothetical protein
MSQEHLDGGKRKQQHGEHCDSGRQAQKGNYKHEKTKRSFSESTDKPGQAHAIRWRIIKQSHENHGRRHMW